MSGPTDTPPRHGRLAGKVAVITGASSGIGRAVALAYAREGARVVVNYHRSAAAAAAVVAEILALSGTTSPTAHAVGADVASPADVERLASAALERFGHIDVWVNNAGADILPGARQTLTDDEKWQAVLAVDLSGTFYCARHAGAIMRAQQDGGRIINMSWDHVAAGQAGTIATIYAAAKGGVEALSKCLARDLAPEVCVNVIAPGWIRTRWGETRGPHIQERVLGATPLGRWGTPEDVAGVAVFLASAEAAFLTGQTIMVNGGVVM